MTLTDVLIDFSMISIPVSYTHLDVYKRQDRNISCLTIENAFMKADQMMYRRKRLQKEAGGMKGRKGFE